MTQTEDAIKKCYDNDGLVFYPLKIQKYTHYYVNCVDISTSSNVLSLRVHFLYILLSFENNLPKQWKQLTTSVEIANNYVVQSRLRETAQKQNDDHLASVN